MSFREESTMVPVMAVEFLPQVRVGQAEGKPIVRPDLVSTIVRDGLKPLSGLVVFTPPSGPRTGHYYACTGNGRISSIQSITREQLRTDMPDEIPAIVVYADPLDGGEGQKEFIKRQLDQGDVPFTVVDLFNHFKDQRKFGRTSDQIFQNNPLPFLKAWMPKRIPEYQNDPSKVGKMLKNVGEMYEWLLKHPAIADVYLKYGGMSAEQLKVHALEAKDKPLLERPIAVNMGSYASLRKAEGLDRDVGNTDAKIYTAEYLRLANLAMGISETKVKPRTGDKLPFAEPGSVVDELNRFYSDESIQSDVVVRISTLAERIAALEAELQQRNDQIDGMMSELAHARSTIEKLKTPTTPIVGKKRK